MQPFNFKFNHCLVCIKYGHPNEINLNCGVVGECNLPYLLIIVRYN